MKLAIHHSPCVQVKNKEDLCFTPEGVVLRHRDKFTSVLICSPFFALGGRDVVVNDIPNAKSMRFQSQSGDELDCWSLLRFYKKKDECCALKYAATAT
jgi:hypothetical protein